MKEELLAKAESALIDIIDTFVKAKDFAIEQAPEVVEQLLTWYFVESLIFFILGGILLTIIPIMWYLIYKFDNSIDDFCGFVGTIFTFIFGIAGPLLVFNNLDWLQIWIAPKLWLVEYAAKLLN